MNLSDLREITNQIDDPSQYNSYIVYYTGDIITPISTISQATVIFLSPYIAVIFVKIGYENLITSIPNINIIEPDNYFMLSQISPLQTSNIVPFSEGIPMELTGTGVIVGTIDTGIDYLNREFIREDGSSRILSIWDQSNNDGPSPPNINYGTS